MNMKNTVSLILALLGFFAFSFSVSAAEPDKPGTKLIQIQGGGFPGYGALISGSIAITDLGKSHLYGGLQFGANLRTGAVTGEKRMELSAAPRLTLGFNLSRVVELHFGGLAGVAMRRYEKGSSALKFCYGGLGGFRFNVSPSFGIVLEGCYSEDLPYASGGIAFRF